MSLASVALFAGCQKNEIKEVSVEENASTFELVADIAQTKTTLDGRVVEWEEGDIIYMVTSDGTWGVPYLEDNTTTSIAEFTYAGGKFTTPATIADGSYTFNAIYSNGSQMSYHRSDKTTNQLSATQNQNCANPTAHIKKYDALVGTITASVPMNEPAKLTMSHLYTMMQVNIVNNTDAEITVSKFEMTVADADLAGVFTVTSFATPAITAKEGEADTKTITVNVTGGTVAKDATLPVYFVMAPLSDYSGNVTFKVTDSEGKTYTKTIGLSNITFEAGKYNTTPYAISEADEVDALIEDGTYVIAVLEDGVYNAVSSDANDVRRAYVELNDYSGEESYVSHNSKIVWTITNVVGGITINTGDQYWGTKKNGITLVDSNNAATIAVSRSENAYLLSADCGNDGIRYVSKNGTYGFGFYAESNKEDIYLIPATFVALPNLDAPVVTAALNSTKDGINVSWNAVPNAQKYVVTCGENSVEVTTINYEFTGLSAGTYSITVKAVAENYNSATSEAVSVTVPSAGDGDEGNTGGTYYVKVATATPGPGTYLYVLDKGYVFTGDVSDSSWGKSAAVTIDDNKILATDVVNAYAIILEEGSTSGQYAVKLPNGQYLQTSTQKPSSKPTKTYMTYDVVEGLRSVSNDQYYFHGNGSSQNKFRWYKLSSNQLAGQLYKLN